jgi:hypothetical protein
MKNDGGPAFPLSAPDCDLQFGMSLRDWFAGQALVGIATKEEVPGWSIADQVDRAYEYADEMIGLKEYRNGTL